MTTIAQQILALQTMPAGPLATRYADLFGKPPRVRNVAWLRRQVAWKLQAMQFGGLSPRAQSRLDELVARTELPVRDATPPRTRGATQSTRSTANAPMPGTVLVREWHGQQIRVECRENAFVWNGVTYRSLSAVAKAATGAGWSGALFFNLRKRSPSA